MSSSLSDDRIRRMARDRVEFRQHALAYILVNLFLAGVWFFDGDRDGYWPVWVHLAWGIGLAFHGFRAYGPERSGDAIAREEAKLRQKHGRT